MTRIKSAGFTLIEILMVLALIGILTVISITAIESVSNDAAFDQTYHKMSLIKIALIGDLDTNKQGLREYFGYLGDIGGLPSTSQGLQALITKPAGYISYAINSTSKTGMGWRGPYLKSTTGIDWIKDAWGNDFVYNADTTTPYIRSYGADGVAGGTGAATDIQIDFPPSSRLSTIYGVINRNSIAYTGAATIELYEPNGTGILTSPVVASRTTTIAASDNGRFTFSNVSFGLRSLKVTMGTDIIGPSIISVDNVIYSVPHNFLDSTPGAMPHVCSDLTASRYAPGTIQFSPTTNRIYFDVNLDNSMTINSIYVQTNKNVQFKAVRIGNDTRGCAVTCTGSTCSTTQSTICCTGSSTTNCSAQSVNETRYYPEIAMTANWNILGGQNVGAYIEFTDITGVNWVQLRLGCDMIFAQ